jgi:hypothetical protein
MTPLRHRLACLALVVILSAATVSASVPTGTVTCNEADFSIQIVKTYEAGKVQKVDVTIGTGKNPSNDAADSDCTYTAGTVSDPSGLTVAMSDITGSATKITYGSDTSGTDGKAKCGGTLKDNTVTKNGQSVKVIEYTVDVEVIVRETIRNVIDRELKYKLPLVCQLTKDVAAKAGAQGWVIDTASLTATDATGDTKTITFGIDINFHADSSGTAGAAIADGAKYVMGSWVHIRVKETVTNALFKFVTKKCWFMASSDVSGTKDIFFDNYCPIETSAAFDDYTEISGKTDPKFDMKVKAFFFTGKSADKVTVACDLFICLTDDTSEDCTQRPRTPAKDATPKGCAMTAKRRRRNALPELLRGRRSVDDKNNRGWIEHRVVQSKQAIMLDRNDVVVPTCGGDFVYDRVTRTCSNENLLEISGLYLDLPWNVEYANTSSQTFKDFARGKAYQLYVLTQMTDSPNVIVGLEVVSAKKGSVILTVRIKYSATSNAASAFEVFQRAILNVPARQRATNTLNIRSDKVIEYVQVKRPSPSSGLNVENLTLIIVIVVLCAAVFISVIAVLKVRQARRGASSNAGSEMKAHDNPNFS